MAPIRANPGLARVGLGDWMGRGGASIPGGGWPPMSAVGGMVGVDGSRPL